MHDLLIGANYLLILGSTLIALCYLSNTNRLGIYVFCFLATLFGLVGQLIPDNLGYFYYIGAALTDLLIVYVLSRLANPTKLISKIQELCILFIAANFAGWVMYMAYLEPIYYTVLCFLLYSRMILITNGGVYDLGNNPMDSGYIRFFSNDNANSYVVHQDKTEPRN